MRKTGLSIMISALAAAAVVLGLRALDTFSLRRGDMRGCQSSYAPERQLPFCFFLSSHPNQLIFGIARLPALERRRWGVRQTPLIPLITRHLVPRFVRHRRLVDNLPVEILVLGLLLRRALPGKSHTPGNTTLLRVLCQVLKIRR